MKVIANNAAYLSVAKTIRTIKSYGILWLVAIYANNVLLKLSYSIAQRQISTCPNINSIRGLHLIPIIRIDKTAKNTIKNGAKNIFVDENQKKKVEPKMAIGRNSSNRLCLTLISFLNGILSPMGKSTLPLF